MLVDPSFAGQFDHARSPAGKKTARDTFNTFIGGLRVCEALARAKKLSQADPHHSFKPPPDLSRDETAHLPDQLVHPAYCQNRISEFENFFPRMAGVALNGTQENAARRSFGNMPVEVLTAGIPFDDPGKLPPDNKAHAGA